MIYNWKHKGLESFFIKRHIDMNKSYTKGISAKHADRLGKLLTALHAANDLKDLNNVSYKLHKLKGDKKGFYAIKVDANWRITFKFEKNSEGARVTFVNYEDYH